MGNVALKLVHNAPLWPSYRNLLSTGELVRRTRLAVDALLHCDVCPHNCGAKRLNDEVGACGAGRRALVASHQLHFAEEQALVGSGGSGTIFFGKCNLRCHFCQNPNVSQGSAGQELSSEELAAMMLDLQEQGAHNINLVSPSHVVPQILEALCIAAPQGLRLPLVYNSGGYDSLRMLRLLDGIVDIYLPDAKYADSELSFRYSEVADYPIVNQEAILEMQRQVGELVFDEEGLAHRGLIVRHLVLPDGSKDSARIADFLATQVSPRTYVNVMSQYYPRHRAFEHVELRRRITWREYLNAVSAFRSKGLRLAE